LQTISNFTFSSFDGTPQNIGNNVIAATGTSSAIQLSVVPGTPPA
jgi:hypothetical protein